MFTIKPPNEPHKKTVADKVRKMVEESGVDTIFSVSELADKFDSTPKYIGRIFAEMNNSTVALTEEGTYRRIANDDSFVGSRELRESFSDHGSTAVDTGGGERHSTRRGAGQNRERR